MAVDQGQATQSRDAGITPASVRPEAFDAFDLAVLAHGRTAFGTYSSSIRIHGKVRFHRGSSIYNLSCAGERSLR